MHSRIIGLALIATAFVGLSAPASAQSIGLTAGTPGIGAELGFQANESFGVRLTTGYFKMSRDVDVNDIDYDGKLHLKSLGALADFYPFESGFRLTGGGILNRNRVNITATPTSNVTVGDTSYTPAQIGRLDGRIDFKDFAPYAGIGFTGNRMEPGLAFVFDLGVMFQGTPRVTLAGSGPVAGSPQFAADIERERAEIQDEVHKYKYYPVAKIGLAYRF